MRTHGFPASVHKPLSMFRDDARLKAHSLYRAAKAGEAEPAGRLVMDLARSLAEQAAETFAPGCIYVSPHAREASGDNAIPQALAQLVANVARGEADLDIVQVTRVFHTGADPMERLNTGPNLKVLCRRQPLTCWLMTS